MTPGMAEAGGLTSGEVAIRLIESLGANEFAERIIGILKAYMRVDAGLVLQYSDDALPTVLFDDMEVRKWNYHEKIYLDGMYLLDPFYLVAVEERRSGLFALAEVAPDSFYESEYFKSYYGVSIIGDEVNFLIPLRSGAIVAISLSRHRDTPRFDADEMRRLRDIEPLVRAAVIRHYSDLRPIDQPDKGSEIHRALEAAMDKFGSSILTRRECDVARMILRGHSSKSAAPRLGISPETVKLHRRNLYAKLEISSQTELFSLFIDSVSSAKNLLQDPLLDYNRRN